MKRVLKAFLLFCLISLPIIAQQNRLLQNTFSPSDSVGTNYFPVNIQNKWQYLRTTYDSDGPTYMLSYISVVFDTVIGNYQYYQTTESSDLIRYSVMVQVKIDF